MTTSEKALPAKFSFENLSIERVILHHVFAPTADKQLVDPDVSQELIKLNQKALGTLQRRMLESLAHSSHGVEMSIERSDNGSFFQRAAGLMHSNEATFVKDSEDLAHSLNRAQLNSRAPEGMLVVLSGRVGLGELPFLAVIKAEPQDGFLGKKHKHYVGMEYVANVLLTKAQRFYKIGLIVQKRSEPPVEGLYDPSNFRSFLFDQNMTATETRPAAVYFYSGFLGMSIEQSAKKQTQNFYDYTRKYIDTADLDQQVKGELHEALRSELRSEEATISAPEFAKKHFPQAQRAKYLEYMTGKGFPDHGISKDLDYIRARLRRKRKFSFNNGVVVLSPPEQAKDYLEIEPPKDGTTVVRIKGELEGQQ